MSNFTPGPWKLDGECFTTAGHYDAPRVFSYADRDNPRFIAEIAVSNFWEPNGNLIAAAPEMYEALRYALLILENHPGVSVDVLPLKFSLAKAEGKSK